MVEPSQPCCLCGRTDCVVYVVSKAGRTYCGPCWRGETKESK